MYSEYEVNRSLGHDIEWSVSIFGRNIRLAQTQNGSCLMKILLVQPPDTKEIAFGYPKDYGRRARSYLPPLGLLYIAAYLKQDHDVRAVDLMAEYKTAADIVSYLSEFKPGIVAMPAIITLWRDVLDTLEEVRRFDPSIQVVVGGPNATKYPKETISHSVVDYVIVGSGQIPLKTLCDKLDAGESGLDIANCYHRTTPTSRFAPVKGFVPLDDFPMPDLSALPADLYKVPFCPDNPTTSMMSSQGCPFKCAYCDSKNLKPVKVRGPARVVAEMKQAQLHGIKSVFFQDELFTMNQKSVQTLCEMIQQEGIDLHWTIKSRIDLMRDWMPDLLKRAGCFNVHFGIESGNAETLKRMNKGITPEQIKATIANVKKAGLSCSGNFMLGYPGETELDIYRNIEFARALELNLTQYSVTVDLPDTEMWDENVLAGNREPGNPWADFTRDPTKTDFARTYASERFGENELFGFLEYAIKTTETLYNVRGKGEVEGDVSHYACEI